MVANQVGHKLKNVLFFIIQKCNSYVYMNYFYIPLFPLYLLMVANCSGCKTESRYILKVIICLYFLCGLYSHIFMEIKRE